MPWPTLHHTIAEIAVSMRFLSRMFWVDLAETEPASSMPKPHSANRPHVRTSARRHPKPQGRKDAKDGRAREGARSAEGG